MDRSTFTRTQKKKKNGLIQKVGILAVLAGADLYIVSVSDTIFEPINLIFNKIYKQSTDTLTIDWFEFNWQHIQQQLIQLLYNLFLFFAIQLSNGYDIISHSSIDPSGKCLHCILEGIQWNEFTQLAECFCKTHDNCRFAGFGWKKKRWRWFRCSCTKLCQTITSRADFMTDL